MRTLMMLPVELLYDVQLLATSHALPQTCKTLYYIFTSSPSSYRAQYLIACTDPDATRKADAVLTKMLRYPICTQPVLEAYFRHTGRCREVGAPQLPRRLFRTLVGCYSSSNGGRLDLASPSSQPRDGWSDRDSPLPFLRYLYTCPHLRAPKVNSHGGYALTKAVQVGFIPLVRFLLEHGATPAWKDNLAVHIAIHREDLGLVRMLVERTGTASGKRGKVEDRVEVTPAMLRAAVKCKAQDIVEYFTKEKGCIPDMQTLLLMAR